MHHEVRKAAQSDHKRIVVVTGGPGSGKSVDRAVAARRAQPRRSHRAARHRARGRSRRPCARWPVPAAARAEDVQVLQPVHDGRAQQPRRARPRRGAPHPADLRRPVHEGRAADGPRAGRRADRCRPRAGVPAGRAPGRAARRDGLARRHHCARRAPRARGHDRPAGGAVPLRRQPRVRRSGSSGCSGSRPAGRAVGGRPGFAVEVADSPQELEQRLAERQDAGYSARDDRRLLLAMERPASRRLARARRPDRRLGPPVEPQGRPQRRRSAPVSAVGERSARLRPGRLRLHRAGLRVRLERRHPRPGPGRPRRPLDHCARRQQGPGLPQPHPVDDRSFDLLVRNVYKVLLTRGMVGTVLYSTDPETRDLLRRLIT